MSNVQSAYEKMLQDPNNRVSSAGMMKQPTPNGAEVGGADMSQVTGIEEKVSVDPEEAAYFAGVDARMSARMAGNPVNETLTVKSDVETRLKEVEDLLVEVMKVHMKIIKKGLV